MDVVLRHSALLLSASLLLAACGGGGSSSTPAPAPSPAPAPAPAPAPPPADISAISRADPGSSLSADWRAGPFMQIFVRSYQDSDGDGVGDLRGLTSRLDYLRDLGIRGLWLLPITRSQDGDHGYAVSDYRNVETAYGSLADLDELLRQAHARGIGVVLDYVINHSAGQHPLFQAARSDAASPWRPWYVWQASVPSGWNVFGGNPWRSAPTGAYYAPFWDQMPDWNLREPAVVDFHRHNLRFWMNRGVDGFRFDAVGLLIENGSNAWENQPENWNLLRDAYAAETGAYANRFLVCEAPSAVASAAAACGRAFDFGTQGKLLAVARGDAGAAATLAATSAPATHSPFLSNHDEFAGHRPFDQLNGELPALKLAAALSLLRAGTPFVYYGEEVGMNGGAGLSGDPRLRSPMSWTADATHAGFSTRTPYRALAANSTSMNVAAQQADPASLLHHYRALMTLRAAQPALRSGTQDTAQAQGAALAWWRRDGSEQVLVIVHGGRSSLSASFSGAPANAPLQRIFGSGGDAQADAQGTISLTLPAQSIHVFKVQP